MDDGVLTRTVRHPGRHPDRAAEIPVKRSELNRVETGHAWRRNHECWGREALCHPDLLYVGPFGSYGRGSPEEVGALAAGTDQTHFSSQHVDKLWEIIDSGVMEKPSDSGQLCVLTSSALRVVHRGAEFQGS